MLARSQQGGEPLSRSGAKGLAWTPRESLRVQDRAAVAQFGRKWMRWRFLLLTPLGAELVRLYRPELESGARIRWDQRVQQALDAAVARCPHDVAGPLPLPDGSTTTAGSERTAPERGTVSRVRLGLRNPCGRWRVSSGGPGLPLRRWSRSSIAHACLACANRTGHLGVNLSVLIGARCSGRPLYGVRRLPRGSTRLPCRRWCRAERDRTTGPAGCARRWRS